MSNWGVLDLVLGERDVDLRLLVDLLKVPAGEQNVLAEDPHAGDEVGGVDVVRVLVDLADVTVGGLDLVSDQVGARGLAGGQLAAPDVVTHKVRLPHQRMLCHPQLNCRLAEIERHW